MTREEPTPLQDTHAHRPTAFEAGAQRDTVPDAV